MAQIQWYPGHMHKAVKGIREVLSQVDMFIELLDARIPFSSSNPLLAELRGGKPCIKVMTKSDLADPEQTEHWKLRIESEQGIRAVIASIQNRQQIQSLGKRCREILSDNNQPRRTITVMVVGIPNVGKSTIINILANRRIAKTGNEAAITKTQQRIPLDHGIVLLDTPGVLWPKVESPASGNRLAATGAIRDTAFTHQEVARFAAEFLLAQYPELVLGRYQYKAENSGAGALLEHIGRQRGCLGAGNIVDLDRVAKLLLNDFREGAIGRITLETPEMVQQEKTEVEKVKLQKAAYKEQRKRNRKNPRG